MEYFTGFDLNLSTGRRFFFRRLSYRLFHCRRLFYPRPFPCRQFCLRWSTDFRNDLFYSNGPFRLNAQSSFESAYVLLCMALRS